MPLGIVLMSACAGCIGPHYTEHPVVLVKKKPPEIIGPYDPAIAQNLSTNAWSRSPFGPESAVVVVWFKSLGIAGWKDYHMRARAQGPVVPHQISSSGFLTVDLRLNSLTVDDVPIPIAGMKYMRLEIFLGKVGVQKAVRHDTNEVLSADGKLVWDSDGWFEIHPQASGDVKILSQP